MSAVMPARTRTAHAKAGASAVPGMAVNGNVRPALRVARQTRGHAQGRLVAPWPRLVQRGQMVEAQAHERRSQLLVDKAEDRQLGTAERGHQTGNPAARTASSSATSSSFPSGRDATLSAPSPPPPSR